MRMISYPAGGSSDASSNRTHSPVIGNMLFTSLASTLLPAVAAVEAAGAAGAGAVTVTAG